MEKAIKKSKSKMDAEHEHLPGDLLKIWEKIVSERRRQMMNDIGNWPKDFTNITNVALKMSLKATKKKSSSQRSDSSQIY